MNLQVGAHEFQPAMLVYQRVIFKIGLFCFESTTPMHPGRRAEFPKADISKDSPTAVGFRGGATVGHKRNSF